MIAWWIGLAFATKAYFVTVTFIVVWSVGLKYVSDNYLGG